MQRKNVSPEKSPDREHQPIVVEKEAPSTAGEKDAHPTVSTPVYPTTPVTREQSLVGEEKGTQTPTEGSETLSIIPEKELSSAPIIEEKGTLSTPTRSVSSRIFLSIREGRRFSADGKNRYPNHCRR